MSVQLRRWLGAAWLAAASACAVDETSYLSPDRIHYTAPEPLSADADAMVVLVGTPRAVRQPGGVLSVTTDGDTVLTEVPITNADGTFVASFPATKGQKIGVEYLYKQRRETLELALDDELKALPEPISAGTSGDSGAPDVLSPFTATANGTLAIGFADFEGITPPIVVYNTRSAGSSVVERVADETSLAVAVGDNVCLFVLGSDAAPASTNFCGTVK